VIYLLVKLLRKISPRKIGLLIHLSEVFIFDIATPEYIPVAIPFDHLKPSILEGIHDSIIDVCGIIDPE
jgi:hypothetical protein